MVEQAKVEQTEREFRDLVRLVDRDVSGKTNIWLALTKVKGIGFVMSNAICNALNIDKFDKIGNCSQKEIEKIEDCARNPVKYGIPSWMLNRRKDFETGADRQLISADLKLQKEFDIRHLKKIKAYRGVRHQIGAKKVRGQRTRTTGRRGTTLGVALKKARAKVDEKTKKKV